MLSPAKHVARHAVSRFDEVTLSPSPRGLLAVYSDATGTWARALDGNQPEQRLTDRCAAGLAVLSDASLWLACGRPCTDECDTSKTGLFLYELDAQLRPRSERRLGPLARDGQGVALAAGRDQLWVAWGDGMDGTPAVQLASMPLYGHAQAAALRPLSAPSHNGQRPSLLWLEPHLYASWSESELAAGGEMHRVMIARDAEQPRRILQVRIPDAAPRLSREGSSLVVSYRNASSASARSELYVARISAQLALVGGARRLGRANSEGPPLLSLCSGTRAAIAPLEHAGELYVAFHPLSAALRASEANHQYYESGREFVASAASCQGGAVRALLAERTQPARPGAELLSVEFRCNPRR